VLGAVLASLLTLLTAAPAQPQDDPEHPAFPEAQVRVDLSRREITAGDRVAATVRLVWPAGAPDVEPRFPAWQETWGDAEILSVGPLTRTRAPGGDLIFTQTVELTTFEVGDATLPPVILALPLGEETRQVKTPEKLAITVRSVLGETERTKQPAVLPPAPPEALPIGPRFAWTAGLLTLAVAALAWRVTQLRAREAGAAVPRRPRLPPLEELRQRLARLDPEASEAAHAALSFALRAFIARTAGLPALERTTTEIQRLLRDSHLEPDWCRRLVRVLRRADEAKFVPGVTIDAATTAIRVREAEAIAIALDEDLKQRREAEAAAAREAA